MLVGLPISIRLPIQARQPALNRPRSKKDAHVLSLRYFPLRRLRGRLNINCPSMRSDLHPHESAGSNCGTRSGGYRLRQLLNITPRIVFGFNADPERGLGKVGIPIKGTDYVNDHISMVITVPKDKRVSRRQLSANVNGKVIPLPFRLKIMPPGSSKFDEVEYVTKPAVFEMLRRVEAKADKAIGLATQANTKADDAVSLANSAQQSADRANARIDRIAGGDDASGAYTQRLYDAENALKQHADDIQQLRRVYEDLVKQLSAPPANQPAPQTNLPPGVVSNPIQ